MRLPPTARLFKDGPTAQTNIQLIKLHKSAPHSPSKSQQITLSVISPQQNLPNKIASGGQHKPKTNGVSHAGNLQPEDKAPQFFAKSHKNPTLFLLKLSRFLSDISFV
jgi:hypothetical protein